MTEVEAGKWFLYVLCREPDCENEIVVEVADQQPPDVQDPIEVRCPFCGTPGRWEPEEIGCSYAPKMD
jgi:hypothetical protein